jgi:hypothetical protein
MKILITVGMVIIFISAFFVFLTGDVMIRNAFDCSMDGGRQVCIYRGLPGPVAFGAFIIGFFIIIDILTLYLIFTNAE